MSRAALPLLRDGDGPVARQDGKMISRATFLSQVRALAAQLPERTHVVNFCSDRYRFAVAWAAAMLRGQVTLLPSSRDAGSIVALQVDYPALYVLSDVVKDGSLPAPHVAYPALGGAGGGGSVPAFPPDRIAAILFTSGSTGRPNPSPRRWGRLVSASLAAGAALGVGRFEGSVLIATVPHAHSYGLESAVMLALQHGLLLTADRPFFPADVAAALDRDRLPGILVTTPVHLRALVGDAAGPGFGTSFRAGFVLSATAPLSAELAARAEAAFNAPVFEIYGCSEAGQLASRRTLDGPVWRCLDGFRLHQDAAGCWASGPDEDDVLLADQIETVGGGGFILQGRSADLVNVAGKRSSLAYLTRQLLAIEGVKDGVFLMPAGDATGVTSRLAAVVVAPGLTAAAIIGRLRGMIDDAFLPRPLRVVEALPRNDLGKLPRAELLYLAGVVPDEPALSPIRLRFAADHPAASGHFPGNPVIPGAVMLDELVAALFPGGWTGDVEAAKFHHPVRPGDTVAVTHRTEAGSIRFECHLVGRPVPIAVDAGDAQAARNQEPPGTSLLVLSGVLRAKSPSL
jgi:acyl-CoA synthetase (AMP-forming)/AMP-acid ligase II